MRIPLQVAFRNMETSPAVEARISEELEKLSQFYERITNCRVMVEIPHRHRGAGKRFHIRIYLSVPGGEIVAKHEPSRYAALRDFEIEKHRKDQELTAPHKDVYVAIRDAFKSARRQLQEFVREQRGDVKRHEIQVPAGAASLPRRGFEHIEITESE